MSNAALLDKLTDLNLRIYDELPEEIVEHLEEQIDIDPEIQAALCVMAKRYMTHIEKYIDADRLGELIIEADIDPELILG